MDRLPRIPLADIVDRFVDWLTMTFGGFFDGISNGFTFVNAIVSGLGFIPSILLTVILQLSLGGSVREELHSLR